MGKPERQKIKAESHPSFFSKTPDQSSSMANNFVMEERKELMVSPTGGHEYFRTAHFLTRPIASTNGAAAPSPGSSSSAAADFADEYKDIPCKVNIRGWRYTKKNWKTWVDQMKPLHHSIWKKAGIFDAIMSSTYSIQRNHDLIFGFAKKWCPATNSFVFPWGEATITLEDVMVLGGFSLLGEFVSRPPENEEMEEIVKKLLSARSDIARTNSRNANQTKWMTKFMGSQSDIEHEGFLAFWLSRFVFPISQQTHRTVLPVAVRLARGVKVALAPAVLAGIYKNLTSLKDVIVAARKSETNENQNGSVTEAITTAPLALLQAWIWERFPPLSPNPNSIQEKEPRISRWHNVKKSRSKDIMNIINFAAKNFQWRPYTSSFSSVFHRKIYRDDEYWALVGPNFDEDLEALIRCLRPSELVGFEANCVQHYLPHRVAMQFGLDQDIPSCVERVDLNSEISWKYYCRPIRDTKLYVPPRINVPRVTTQYLDWWGRLNVQVKKDLFDSRLSSTANNGAELVLSEKGSSKCSKRKFDGIKEIGAEFLSSGSCRNHHLQEDAQGENHCSNAEYGQNVEVNPSSVESRRDELLLGMKDRVKNIEKLCAWLKAGKLVPSTNYPNYL